MIMKKKKVLIVLLSIITLIIAAIGGIGAYFLIESNKPPVELEDTDAKFETTLKAAPTDGSLPTEHDPIDVIYYSLWSVANSNEFKVITEGNADAGITTQKIFNTRVVKNNNAMISTISEGLISLGTQRFYFSLDDNKVLVRKSKKISDLNAIWDSESDPECVTYNEIKRRYGWYPYQANGYIICDDTLLDKENIYVLDNNDNTYDISFSLDPDGEAAPFWYRREIITSSGSTMIPIFSSIKITFKIDKNYKLLSQQIEEVYTVKAMGVEAKTKTNVIDTFTYDNVEFDMESYNWFLKYKELEPSKDINDNLEAKEPDIMSIIVSSLQTKDNSSLNFDLNANVLDKDINGLLSLNINDLNNVYVLFKLEDLLYAEFDNDIIYLKILNSKYKCNINDINLNNDLNISIDDIINELNSGTIKKENNKIFINTSISLLNIKLDLDFDIDYINDDYILNNINAKLNILDNEINISCNKTLKEINKIDQQEFKEDLSNLINDLLEKLENNNKEELINLFKEIINILEENELNINLDLSIYDNDIKHLDIISSIKLYKEINGEYDIELSCTIYEYNNSDIKMVHNINIKYLSKSYFNRNEIDNYSEDLVLITYGTNPNKPENLIKMKTKASDILKAIGTITKLLNIDLSFINNYSSIDFDKIDVSQIKDILLNTNINDINLDDLFNEINIQSNNLSLDLNLSNILNNSNTSTVINLELVDNNINLNLKDLYIKDNVKLDINDISIKSENVIITMSESIDSYIDISSMDELISSLVVTASNKSFEIEGELSLKALGFDSVNIPLNVKVKIDENNKTCLYAKLDYEKGFITNLTNIISNDSTEYYYKDGYIIINVKYTETKLLVIKTTKYKSIKVSIDEFLNNLKYYVFDFGMGLSSTILNSMDSTENDNLIDASKVLTNYEENNKVYNIGLNIGELTGVSGIEDLNIKLESKEVLYNGIYIDALTSINSLSLKMFSVLEIKLNESISLKNLDYDTNNNLVFIDVIMEEEMNYINSYSYEIGEIVYS